MPIDLYFLVGGSKGCATIRLCTPGLIPRSFSKRLFSNRDCPSIVRQRQKKNIPNQLPPSPFKMATLLLIIWPSFPPKIRSPPLFYFFIPHIWFVDKNLQNKLNEGQ
jgi:hypothetical protein